MWAAAGVDEFSYAESMNADGSISRWQKNGKETQMPHRWQRPQQQAPCPSHHQAYQDQQELPLLPLQLRYPTGSPQQQRDDHHDYDGVREEVKAEDLDEPVRRGRHKGLVCSFHNCHKFARLTETGLRKYCIQHMRRLGLTPKPYEIKRVSKQQQIRAQLREQEEQEQKRAHQRDEHNLLAHPQSREENPETLAVPSCAAGDGDGNSGRKAGMQGSSPAGAAEGRLQVDREETVGGAEGNAYASDTPGAASSSGDVHQLQAEVTQPDTGNSSGSTAIDDSLIGDSLTKANFAGSVDWSTLGRVAMLGQLLQKLSHPNWSSSVSSRGPGSLLHQPLELKECHWIAASDQQHGPSAAGGDEHPDEIPADGPEAVDDATAIIAANLGGGTAIAGTSTRKRASPEALGAALQGAPGYSQATVKAAVSAATPAAALAGNTAPRQSSRHPVAAAGPDSPCDNHAVVAAGLSNGGGVPLDSPPAAVRRRLDNFSATLHHSLPLAASEAWGAPVEGRGIPSLTLNCPMDDAAGATAARVRALDGGTTAFNVIGPLAWLPIGATLRQALDEKLLTTPMPPTPGAGHRGVSTGGASGGDSHGSSDDGAAVCNLGRQAPVQPRVLSPTRDTCSSFWPFGTGAGAGSQRAGTVAAQSSQHGRPWADAVGSGPRCGAVSSPSHVPTAAAVVGAPRDASLSRGTADGLLMLRKETRAGIDGDLINKLTSEAERVDATVAAASAGSAGLNSVNGSGQQLVEKPATSSAAAVRIPDLDVAQMPSVIRLVRAAGQLGINPPALILRAAADSWPSLLPAPPPPGAIRILLQAADGSILPGRIVTIAPAQQRSTEPDEVWTHLHLAG